MQDEEISYWWVNHGQTFKAEVEGGYIWSPKRNTNGAFNQTYQNLSLVKPGDIVVSFAGTLIKAIGVASQPAVTQGKPEEFGAKVGVNWSENDGWLVSVNWIQLASPIKPKGHIDQIAPLLPSKYSPLRATGGIDVRGNGNQSCYLASISTSLGLLVLNLVEHSNPGFESTLEELSEQLKGNHELKKIADSELSDTNKEQLINARQGQGLFRQRVIAHERRCRVTGVTDERFLTASHIRPWRSSDNHARLDGENGLLLSPHVDKLFDRGWISFSDTGDLMSNDEAHSIMTAWKIDPTINVGLFTPRQCEYLSYHREHIFRPTL